MAEKGSTNTNTNTKKRDSRAGMRKVTSLTAEQLERKRANDREAQRTIRARTKEHIERLERQVAELTAKGQQVDRVLERNAALEAEIAHLRQQLAMMTSRQLYPSEDERRSSTSSNPASVISSPFNSPPMTDSLPPGPSMPPLTHRMSLPQSAWHAYVPQPPPASAIPSVSGPEAPGETVAYHHQQHDIGYNNDSYRNLAYPPPSRAAPTSHHQQHMPVATLGYDSSIPALQATHLPVPSHLQQQQQPQQQQQQQHAYPSNLVHSPPSQTHIGYQWDSRG